jgi:hypothetical protein
LNLIRHFFSYVYIIHWKITIYDFIDSHALLKTAIPSIASNNRLPTTIQNTVTGNKANQRIRANKAFVYKLDHMLVK